MCSGAGTGAAGSAGGGGAVDAGCLDPMLDRLLAVDVAGPPDSALAADLVGLRVAVSRLESEFARRLVVFDRRGAAGGHLLFQHAANPSANGGSRSER